MSGTEQHTTVGGRTTATTTHDAAEPPRRRPRLDRLHRRLTVKAPGSFSDVQQRGYTVLDFADPLRSLSIDSAGLASFLQHRTSGRMILVGHSYGGAVIAEAGTSDPGVRALVYVDAFVAYVASDEAAYLNGASLDVEGGYCA